MMPMQFHPFSTSVLCRSTQEARHLYLPQCIDCLLYGGTE